MEEETNLQYNWKYILLVEWKTKEISWEWRYFEHLKWGKV